MHLKLDTVPSMQSVEQWARSLLAEMETLSISGAESSNKRNRVASVASKGGKDAATPTPKAEAKKLDVPSKNAYKHWATETGRRR